MLGPMKIGTPAEVKLLPAYSLAEGARILGVRASTLHAWFDGRSYPSKTGRKWSKPVLGPRDTGRPISFLELVKAHVLMTIRRGYGIPMNHVRVAMEYLTELGKDPFLLAHRSFYHDRRHLFLAVNDRLISLSERGQLVDREIIREGLKQIEYGKDDYASTFFPRRGEDYQRVIALDPTLSFGRPCVASLGVSADAIANRFLAGEGVQELAEDYGATVDKIEEAIRWHDRLAA